MRLIFLELVNVYMVTLMGLLQIPGLLEAGSLGTDAAFSSTQAVAHNDVLCWK